MITNCLTMLHSGQAIRQVVMTGDGILHGSSAVSDGTITGMTLGTMAAGAGMIRTITVGMVAGTVVGTAAGMAIGTALGIIPTGMIIAGTMVEVVTTMRPQSVQVPSVATERPMHVVALSLGTAVV